MKGKKQMMDALVIMFSTGILMGLNHWGLLEKYIGFSLVPILIAYFSGQYVKSKFK